MKTKIILIASLTLLLATSGFAQLRVDNTGRIGMGTYYPNAGYKCHIKGNLLLTTHPDIPFQEFQFKVGEGWNGGRIGSTTDNVVFHSNWVTWNKLFAQQLFLISDSKYKQNIVPISGAIKKISALKSYSYLMEDNSIDENGNQIQGKLKNYGFLSDEVEKALPDVEITKDVNHDKLMDYNQIIPLLVAGMQEQQKQISALEAKMAQLVATCCKPKAAIETGNTKPNGGNALDVSQLLSSTPNPFSNSATINYFLSSAVTHAEIKVWDMQGIEKKTLLLTPKLGFDKVTLEAADLSTNGTYVYALFTDGSMVDAKTLILNK